MPADVDPLGIAPECRGIPVYPGSATAHLSCHHPKIAARVLHRDEVQRNIMSPRCDEHLGRITVALGRAGAPVPAVEKHENRGIGPTSAIDVELFDLRRPVCSALRRADAVACRFATTCKAL